MDRRISTEEHDAFRAMVARFVDEEIAPHHAAWEEQGIVPRELWQRAGKLGLLCTDVAEAYGGGGVADFRYNTIVTEELCRVGASGVGFPLHNDVIVPYLLRGRQDRSGRQARRHQFVDRCIELHNEGRLTVDEAAMTK